MDLDYALRRLAVGAAQVSIITTGVAYITPAELFREPAGGWTPGDLDLIKEVYRGRFQSVHIALGAASVAVDATDVATFMTAHAISLRDRAIQPRIDQQLAQQGIPPTSVTHLILTHAHEDHYCVATVEDEEVPAQRRPLFPSAVVIAEQADWTPEGQQAILASLPDWERAPDAPERYMGELFRRKMVRLVEGDYDVAPGIRLVHAPGETPGHAVVRVHSNGQTLYFLGDLIHLPIEIEHPDWVPIWADPEATVASRNALIAAALAEDALLIAAHIPGIGRLRRDGQRVIWEPVA